MTHYFASLRADAVTLSREHMQARGCDRLQLVQVTLFFFRTGDFDGFEALVVVLGEALSRSAGIREDIALWRQTKSFIYRAHKHQT